LRQKYPLDQKLEPNPRAKTGRFLPYIRGRMAITWENR
jgi:hypothetical protein